jgi:MoaA/NifB/PqqE/SkfB family radical SAM enzyme
MAVTRDLDFLIQWHLTERCNLRCRHCYQGDGTGEELPLPLVREAVTEISEMFAAWKESCGVALAPSFNITGGEPLLRSDIFTIIDDIGRRGFAMFLLTNGTLIDGDTAARLADAGVKGVQVSIEGTEGTHDAIRGEGSFAKALAGAGYLCAAGVPVTLNITVSRLNVGEIPAMIDLTEALGVPRLGIARFVPAGRGMAMAGEMLSQEEVRDLYEWLLAVSVPGLDIVTGDPLATQLRSADSGLAGATACGGCAAGVSGLTLMADGTIVPCRRLEIPLGNIRTHSLREIWATSEVLARLRDQGNYSGRCGACSRWASCRGCRAIAWACSRATGENGYLAEDPQCFFLPVQAESGNRPVP